MLIGGRPTPLKNDGQLVSWGVFPFPTRWKVIKVHAWFQTTNLYMILPYGGFLSHRATSSYPAIEDRIFHVTLQSMGISGSD